MSPKPLLAGTAALLAIATVPLLFQEPPQPAPTASEPFHPHADTSPAPTAPSLTGPSSPQPPATTTPAGLLDFAESYPSLNGPRSLHRFPGRVAIRFKEPDQRHTLVGSLTAPGATLDGFTVAKSWPNHVIELHAPDAIVAAHRTDPSRLTKLIDDLRNDHADTIELVNPVHAAPDTTAPRVTFGDLIVCLSPGHTDPSALGLDTTHIRPLRGTSDQFIATLASPDAQHLLTETTRLAADPRVAWAEPDFIIKIEPAFTPNDPLFPDQWHLENNGQIAGINDADVDASTAWNTTRGSQEIIVAVIDDGFDLNHEDLRSNIFLNPGEAGDDANGNPKFANGRDDDGNGFIDDLNGWNFYEDDNNPSVLGENPFSTKTTLPDNPAPSAIRLRILETSESPRRTSGYTNGEYEVVIANHLGGLLESDVIRFYIYDRDGTLDERPTVLFAKRDSDVPETASTYYDRLMALVEPYFEEGKAFFGSEPEAEQIKTLFSAVFGRPYKLPSHGTAVAGVAVARGHNGKGVSGVAPLCKLLPIKVGFTVSGISESIKYASSFRTPNSSPPQSGLIGADVINMSLSTGVDSATTTALNEAAQFGRNGKGCLTFAASGNDASAWISVEVGFGKLSELLGGAASIRNFRWVYTKDGSIAAGDDAVWIDDVEITPGAIGFPERFNGDSAPLFSASPAGSWAISKSSTRAKGTGGNGSMKTAPLADGGTATLSSPVVSRPGSISFSVWVSCHSSDKFEFYIGENLLFSLSGNPRDGIGHRDSITVTKNEDFADIVSIFIRKGPFRTFPGFPSNNADVLCVGGSTTYDNRVDYSQYGHPLDFVTPTGFSAGNIFTSDVSLSLGYGLGDYASDFNGTSSSSPLAAGIGALLLSVNPDLTFDDARRLLRSACDKIGPDPYVEASPGSSLTRNNFYGYGKLNAAKAVQAGIDSYSEKAPENVDVDVNGVTTRITWTYPYTQVRSLIWKNTQPTREGAASLGYSENTTEAFDYTLAPGITYYAVQTFGPFDGQESAFSDWVQVVRPVRTPVQFRASKGVFTDRVVVSWRPVSEAEDYVLTRTKNNGPPETITLTGTSFTDIDLNASDRITYSLVARAGNTESTPTETTDGFLGVPVAVSATQGTRPGSVRISWTPPSYAPTAYVYRTTTTSPPPDRDNDGVPDIEPLNPDARVAGRFTDNTALDGTPYYYWIAGRTSDGTLTTPSGPALGFTAPSPTFEPGGTSDDPDGPEFRWIDISQTGTEVLATGDDSAAVIDTNPFPLFDDLVSQMSVTSNGYLSSDLNDTGSDFNNDCPIPTPPSAGGGARLYPYHDDLDLRPAGASVFVQKFDYAAHSHQPVPPDRFRDSITVIQWNNVVRLNENQPFSFQVILFRNGDVVYQYLPGNPGGGSASVGLQNANGDQGISVSCNQTGVIPTDRPFAVLLLAPPPTIWSPETEAFVTTAEDEADDALGMGTGDSLREILFYSAASMIRFDPSLTGKTITIQDGPGIAGGPVPVDGRTLDGRDAPGLTISGGGVIRPFNQSGLSALDLRNLTIADSRATGNGGLFNTNTTIFLENVTVRDCFATGDGGVIYTYSDAFRSPIVTLRNCTFINNFAGDEGGALYLHDISRFTVVNCTFANNRADEGGAVYFDNASNGFVQNNIFAANTATVNNTEDVSGLTLANNQGHNLFTVSTGATLRPTDIVADPQLLPLSLSGGPVPVRGLAPGSPAIDAASSTATFSDAHGTPRDLDGDLDGTPLPDIGAFEAPQPNIVVTSPGDTTDPNDGQLTLREAVALANLQPDARIGFDAVKMGSPTVLLNGTDPLVLDGSNSIQVRGSAAGLIGDGNLLGFWRFDRRNGNTILNEATPDAHLDLIEGTELTRSDTRPGFGNSVRITNDESTGAIAQNSATLAPRDQITVAAWVRPNSFSTIGGIAGYYEETATVQAGYSLQVRFPDEFGWRVKTTGSDDFVRLTSSGNFTPGQWYFVVGTYDGQEARLYVDGVLQAAAPATGPIDYDPLPPAGFQVGRIVDSNSNIAMDGLLDDIMVFDSAVSSAEAADLVGLAPNGGITVDANGAPQAFRVGGTTDAFLDNLNLAGAAESGLVVDANATATLDLCTISGNTSAIGGGGIRNYGTLALNRSNVRDNTATGAWGGGIDNIFGGRLTLNYSTVNNNRALNGNGGGIDCFSNATLVLNQSTVSNNSASGQGGGVYVHSGDAQVFHSTIAENASNGSGDGLRINSGSVSSSHSLFANNSNGSDVHGSLTSLGHNLVADASATTGLTGTDVADTNPLISSGLLADRGPTPTYALLPGSPAVDAGSALPERDVTSPGDPVTVGDTNNSPPSGAPALAFDDDPATVYRSFDSNLIAFWDFDTPATGGTASDRVAGHPGSLQENATIGAPGSGRSGDPTDRALAAPGDDDGLLLADASFLNATAISDNVTIAFWQKIDGALDVGIPFQASSTTGADGFGLAVVTPGQGNVAGFITRAVDDEDNLFLVSDPLTTVDWNAWNHIAVVKNGFQREIYLNGDRIAIGTGAEPLAGDFTELRIGFGAIDHLDDLAVYATALNPAQITSLSELGPPAGSGELTVSPAAGLATVNTLLLTSAPDNPAGDPASFRLEGSLDNRNFSLIAEAAIPPFTGRSSTQRIPFNPSGAFSHFRLSFLSAASTANSPAIQVAEVALLDSPQTDQRGRPRLSNGDGDRTRIVDIGAFELQGYIVGSELDGDLVEFDPTATSGGQLRSAIQSANPADVVFFDSVSMRNSTIALDPAKGPLRVSSRLAIITENVIDGRVTLDGSDTTAGLIDIAPGAELTADGLTLTRSTAPAISNGGVLTLTNSTVHDNHLDGTDGAALENRQSATATLTNVTLSNNSTTGRGGAIANAGRLELDHSTVTANAADEAGGIAVLPTATHTSLTHSIVSGNTASSGTPDILGSFFSRGFNHIGSTVGNIGSAATDTHGPAGLSPLRDNGGPSLTHAPTSDSPALDSGNPAITSEPPTDQRRFNRIIAGRIDRGAVEHDPRFLRTGPDSDGDTIPDTYELFYGLNPDDPSDATGDLDLDGFTAAAEFASRSNPDAPSSGLGDAVIVLLPEDRIRIAWNSIPNVSYSVWVSDDSISFTPVANSTTIAFAPVTSIVIDRPATNPTFFQIRTGTSQEPIIRSAE